MSKDEDAARPVRPRRARDDAASGDAPPRASAHDHHERGRGPKGRLAPLRLKLEVLGMRLLYWLVPLLPRETLIALGRAIGRWGFTLVRRERKVALANLDFAFGDTLSAREKRRIARQSFESFGQVGLEIFWARRLDEKTLKRIVEITPEEMVAGKKLFKKKCGIIALASHLGSWEVMNLHTASEGVPFATLARRLRNDPLNEIVNANRRVHGSEVILHDDAARGILRALKKNHAVAIPLDQNTRPDRGGTYATFFGKPVAVSRSVGLFSLRTGAPILPTACFPLRGGRYRLEWGPPIDVDRTAPDAEQRITQACMDFIEKCVRRQPGAWLWMYRRFKYRPTADATGWPFYSKHLPSAVAPHALPSAVAPHALPPGPA